MCAPFCRANTRRLPSTWAQVDAYQLYSNLYTQSDQTDVHVVSPTILNTTSGWTIDPSGQLFGNDVCGLLNFVDYNVFT